MAWLMILLFFFSLTLIYFLIFSMFQKNFEKVQIYLLNLYPIDTPGIIIESTLLDYWIIGHFLIKDNKITFKRKANDSRITVI